MTDLNAYHINKLDKEVLPTLKNESWKYTRLSALENHNYNQQELKTEISKKDFHNPKFYEVKINEDGLTHNLPESISINPSKLEKTENSPFQDDILNQITKANNLTGYKFVVSKNTSLDKPIYISYEFNTANAFINMYNVFEVNAGASIDILEDLNSSTEVFMNYMSRPYVHENGKLGHTIIQDVKYGSHFFNSYDGHAHKNATLNSAVINLGAKLSRSNIFIKLDGENATCSAHGLYALHRDQHHDTASYIHHAKPHTYSFQLYKGIMDDESHGVFTGKVRVEKDAQLINAEQLNKNLLLTKKARANSRPQLEIYADDVKCSHGSTTGQMSEDELFYFESRGINKERARSILARAFAYDVVLKIENLEIRKEVINHLIDKNIVSK